MEAIRPLWEQMPLRLRDASPLPEAPAASFGEVFSAAVEAARGAEVKPVTDLFHAAVEAVRETDAEKVQMEYLMGTGQLDNPSALMIALSKAQMSVNLLVELRNKATDAYNELMRISL